MVDYSKKSAKYSKKHELYTKQAELQDKKILEAYVANKCKPTGSFTVELDKEGRTNIVGSVQFTGTYRPQAGDKLIRHQNLYVVSRDNFNKFKKDYLSPKGTAIRKAKRAGEAGKDAAAAAYNAAESGVEETVKLADRGIRAVGKAGVKTGEKIVTDVKKAAGAIRGAAVGIRDSAKSSVDRAGRAVERGAGHIAAGMKTGVEIAKNPKVQAGVGITAAVVGTGGAIIPAGLTTLAAKAAYDNRGKIGRTIGGEKPSTLKVSSYGARKNKYYASRSKSITSHMSEANASMVGVGHLATAAKHATLKKAGHVFDRGRYAMGSLIQGTQHEKFVRDEEGKKIKPEKGATLGERAKRAFIPKELRHLPKDAKDKYDSLKKNKPGL